MKKSKGKRIVGEHGLTCNVLAAMHLAELMELASIYCRAYNTTVAWNVPPISVISFRPIQDNFPFLNEFPDALNFKKIAATIEGEKGIFIGPVNKLTGEPSGYGVF